MVGSQFVIVTMKTMSKEDIAVLVVMKNINLLP